MESTKRKCKITLEGILILGIIGSILFLMSFANNKLDELITSDREALLIHHDPDNPVHDELARSILDFRPDACKMIEVFDSDFNHVFRVLFSSNDELDETNLTDFPDLVNLFRTNKEGHTNIIIDDKEEDVYFQWTNASDGEHYLIVIYMSRPVVENMWVFNFTCYMILLMVFTLCIRLRFVRHNDLVRYYQSLSEDVQDKLRR